MSFNVAIDGPAGAGKSTVAKQAAAARNLIYVDTGAMYRAMALYFLKKGVDLKDEAAVTEGCREIEIELRYENGVQQVYLNGENVSGQIRTEEVGAAASVTSAYQPVREKLTELQRKLAETEDVIMDGRDIGTCVLPGAQLKIYLTASSAVRARRRYRELEEKGERAVLEEIMADIKERDERDSNRKIAPLKKAQDAVLVDSSDMTIPEVVQTIVSLCRG